MKYPLVRNQLLSAAVAVALGLSGCAGKLGGDKGGLESDALLGKARVLDPRADLVYKLLTAEIAGQRSQYAEALKLYQEAADMSRDARIAERATQIALFLKNTEKALQAANLWAQLDPQNQSAQRISSMLLLKAGQREEGLERFKSLLRLPKSDHEAHLLELVRWLEAELPKADALGVVNRLVDEFPKMAEMHFALALLASNKGEQKMALDEIDRALALHPDWSRARLLQAQVMSQMGDSAAARGAVQQALRADPKNSRLRLIYSQFLAKSGDIKGAQAELKKIIAQDPQNQDARFALATVLMDAGQVEAARHEFQSLVASPKWQTQASFYLGSIEARQQRFGAALQWFDRINEGPLEFEARVNAISALIGLGRMDEARQRLVAVRGGFPNEALRLYLLEAELLTKLKNDAAAFELLSEALEKLPGQSEVLYSRALIAERLGRLDVLEADLRGILEKNPNDANALNALGYSLAERGERLEDAKKYLLKALEQKPDDPAIQDSFGWVNYRLGNYEVALDYLQKAYRAVRDPEIAAHLGEVLWESGRKAEARKIWHEGLSRDPDHADMKSIKARYQEAFH